MDKDTLLETLRQYAELSKAPRGIRDPEKAHSQADAALLSYINDKEITDAFNAIKRWYA